jgi:hypothetical protein
VYYLLCTYISEIQTQVRSLPREGGQIWVHYPPPPLLFLSFFSPLFLGALWGWRAGGVGVYWKGILFWVTAQNLFLIGTGFSFIIFEENLGKIQDFFFSLPILNKFKFLINYIYIYSYFNLAKIGKLGNHLKL